MRTQDPPGDEDVVSGGAGVVPEAAPGDAHWPALAGRSPGARSGIATAALAQRTIRSINHFAFEYGGLSRSPPVRRACHSTGSSLLIASKPARL